MKSNLTWEQAEEIIGEKVAHRKNSEFVKAHEEVVKALRVMVFTQHIHEYLQLYDPQALQQAMLALSMNHNVEVEIAEAREFYTREAGYGEYNRRMDELLGRVPAHLPLAVTDALEEQSIDARMAAAQEMDERLRADRRGMSDEAWEKHFGGDE